MRTAMLRGTAQRERALLFHETELLLCGSVGALKKSREGRKGGGA